MSHLAQSYVGPTAHPIWASNGVSDAARTLETYSDNIFVHIGRTGVFQHGLSQTIIELGKWKSICTAENWGGDGETPIDQSAFEDAERFVGALPEKFHSVEVTPEPNGFVALEWRRGPFRSVIVAFGGNGRVEYAVLKGRMDRSFGCLRYFGMMPLDIYRHLVEVVGAVS